jgi:hypothetical protein
MQIKGSKIVSFSQLFGFPPNAQAGWDHVLSTILRGVHLLKCIIFETVFFLCRECFDGSL